MTVVRAYGVSNFITIAGTAVGLLLTTMTAYVISRKDFKYRNALSFFFYFTTLFNGGMVCSYIFYIQYLHLKDSYLALILPGVFNVFYLLIMRTFVSAIPTALIESAKIDGAGEFYTFNRIVLHIMKPALAVQAIFSFVASWNNYFIPALVLDTADKKTLPILIAQLRSADFLKFDMGKVYMMVAIAILPVIVVYLLLSKFIVRGVALGGVKG